MFTLRGKRGRKRNGLKLEWANNPLFFYALNATGINTIHQMRFKADKQLMPSHTNVENQSALNRVW